MRRMKFKLVLPAALLLALSMIVLAQSGTPTFKQYAVKVENIKNARADLRSHENANTYRTNLRNAAKGGVNFAGRYIVASWGCGTNCSQGAIIDSSNGKVFFPGELAGITNGFCEVPEVSDPVDSPKMADDMESPILYRADSRLLVLKGYKGGDFNKKDGACGIYYLEWTGTEFKQVGFEAGKRSETP